MGGFYNSHQAQNIKFHTYSTTHISTNLNNPLKWALLAPQSTTKANVVEAIHYGRLHIFHYE